MLHGPCRRRELDARSRKYAFPYGDVIRATIVLLAGAGRPNDEIAQRLNTRREVVSKWRKRTPPSGPATAFFPRAR